MNEHDELVEETLVLLYGLHILCWPQENTGRARFTTKFKRFAMKGIPDVHGVLPGGRAFAIELKTGRQKATKEQQRFIDRVTKEGALSFTAWSADQVEQRLRAEGVVT